MILGAIEFFKTFLMLIITVELTIILEETLAFRFELRRGFTGTKTSVIQIINRHLLKILRIDGSPRQFLAVGFMSLFVFLCLGLLPLWGGEAPLMVSHSLWIFLGFMILTPVIRLVFEWALHSGHGWPVVLTSAERSVGSATVLIILGVTLVAMTGTDNFADLYTLQADKGPLLLRFPLAILLAFSFAVVSLFTSFQSIFSRTGDRRQDGWCFDDLLPYLKRSIWSIFIVDVFLGGASKNVALGSIMFILECVVVNLVASVGAKAFFQLREDQAEAFILWRLAPISIFILALSLLFPRGLT